MAILDIKSTEQCRFDMVALGEVMLRLDPGEGRVGHHPSPGVRPEAEGVPDRAVPTHVLGKESSRTPSGL